MSAFEIALPDESWDGVEAGTEALLESWAVGEGDRVGAGDVVAVAVLVKTSYDLCAPASGVLARILVKPEESFARGQSVGVIEA